MAAKNFERDGKYYMLTCPKCLKENDAMFITLSTCVWCGHKEESTVSDYDEVNLTGKVVEIVTNGKTHEGEVTSHSVKSGRIMVHVSEGMDYPASVEDIVKVIKE